MQRIHKGVLCKFAESSDPDDKSGLNSGRCTC